VILRTLATSAAAVALLSSVAPAAVSWSSPSGSSDTVTYSNGQNADVHFGDPTVSSDSFFFFPSGFSALANSTGSTASDSTMDALSLTLHAKSGKQLDRISAGLQGDWSQTLGSLVDVVGTLKITNLATSQVLQQNVVFTPTMPSAAEEGTFDGLVDIDLPDNWINASVSLSSKVSASTIAGGTSFVELKIAHVDAATAPATAIPLPNALAIAPLGFAVAWFARRRMAH
jgi:hypothetical protein